ncbi:MAG: hypothetical protein PHN19_04165 [Patescibacteria group bacterium]|nr:hypothetical protein [Patescibacteria group bacterium]
MFKNKAKTRKILIIAISLALFLIPMFFVSAQTPAPAGAGTLGSGVLGVVNAIIGGICYLAVGVITLFLWITGTVFDWVIGGTTIDASSMNEIVTAGWVIVRDILNILFVLALLGIAFATILKIESYHFKALLPKLLVAALLVNFSKTIALTLVDFSNAIMSGIMGTQNGATASASLLALFNVSSFLDLSLTLGKGLSAWSTEPAVLGTNVAIVGFLGMFTMALAGLAVLLVIRTVVLMILTVFSPVAFVLNVLPVTQKYASKWWEEFTKYLFIGPVVCICYLLALLFAVKFSQGGGIQGLANGVGQQFQTNVGMSAGTIGQFFGMAISCGIMFVGFTFSKEAANGLAGAAMGLVKKGLLGAGALAGGFAWRKGNESLASGSKGTLGKMISGGLKKLGAETDTAEKWGDRTKYLSPTALALGWKERQAKRTAEAMSGVAGYVHQGINKITNKIPGMGKDETDYVRRGQMENVDKHMSDLKRDGRGNPAFYLEEFSRAVRSGDKDKAEAAYTLLASQVDENEIANHPELGAEILDQKISAANIGTNNAQFHEELLTKVFGEKRAAYIAGNVDESKRKNGDYAQAGMSTLNPQTGEHEFRTKEDQAKTAAIFWRKKGANEAVAAHRTAFVEEQYEYERDAKGKVVLVEGRDTTGKIIIDKKTGKPKLVPKSRKVNKKLSGAFLTLLHGNPDQDGEGIGAGWASQTDRFLKDETRSAIIGMKDEIQKEINKIEGANDKKNAQAFLDSCMGIKGGGSSAPSPIVTPTSAGKGPRP